MHRPTTSSTTMGFPSLPASPTLTNPDMILPYGEYDSTPSPPHRSTRIYSHQDAWSSSKHPDMDFSIGPPSHDPIATGLLTPTTTPIIYGNGTMLSDIGEVTEAESTHTRRPRQTQTRTAKGLDSPLASSPTIGYHTATKRSKPAVRRRALSLESTSTVTTEGHNVDMHFEDFDDTVSVDDSNFQGDDEESVADDTFDTQLAIAQAAVLMKREGRLVQNDDTFSSAALSKRAEMILANAKKRLDNMEGNLTRARSSLQITPSKSMSSIHSSSPLTRSMGTPSPPQPDQQVAARLGGLPLNHQQSNDSALLPNSSLGHSRGYSENSLPENIQVPPYIPRSISAGRFPITSSNGNFSQSRGTGPSSPLAQSPNFCSVGLESLNEDTIQPTYKTDPSVWSSTAAAEPYLNHPNDHRGLTRSTSSMQMRDLTDKMKDLKGKISTLRERAKEDHLKRRSLQSLRTPSPFTAAELWYTGTKTADDKEDDVSANAEGIRNSLNEQLDITGSLLQGENEVQEVGGAQNHEPEAPSVYEDMFEEEPHVEVVDNLEDQLPVPLSEQDKRLHTVGENETLHEQYREADDEEYDDDFVSHDELDEYLSEDDVSLYHDTLATPISHEDREDAFDYEHFFLHSAMGTISRQNRRGSFSSEDSVETTRGVDTSSPAAANEVSERSRGHLKNQKSVDSVSTMDTFATAAEDFDQDDAEDYAVQDPFVEPRTMTPLTTKRSTFGSPIGKSETSSPHSKSLPSSRSTSVLQDNDSQSTLSHHASVSSSTSTSTTRSFPLVNKPKSTGTALSPAPAIKELTGSIIRDAVTMNDGKKSAIDALIKDDQILVERLVESLGKCVLGLQEAGRGTPEGRMWRRRLDAAKRVLEGTEGAL